MEISQIQLFDLFRSKFGDKEAEAFVHIIEEKMNTRFELRKHELATKGDIACLKEDILCLRQEIAAVRDSTKDDMRKLKDELLKTIYLTSLGQLFAIVASVISLILLLLKK